MRLVANPGTMPETTCAIGPPSPRRTCLPLTMALKPKILYREKGRLHEAASDAEINGVIKLAVILKRWQYPGHQNNSRTSIRPERTGHNRREKSQIRTGYQNGEPVSVRGSMEFSFNIEPHGSGPDYLAGGRRPRG